MTRKVNYSKLQAPYIELSKIREIADSVRIKNHKKIIPIKPDNIAEKLGFEIIPSTNLFRNSGNEVFQKLRDGKNYKEFIDDFNDEEDYLSTCLSHSFDLNKEVLRIRLRREKLL